MKESAVHVVIALLSHLYSIVHDMFVGLIIVFVCILFPGF